MESHAARSASGSGAGHKKGRDMGRGLGWRIAVRALNSLAGRGHVPPRLVPAPRLPGQVPETQSLSRGLQEAKYELGQASGGGHPSRRRTSDGV